MSKDFDKGKNDSLCGREPCPPLFWGRRDYVNGYLRGQEIREQNICSKGLEDIRSAVETKCTSAA